MDKLVFGNPIFRKGLMQTVRKGDKRHLNKGHVELVDYYGNTQGTGYIVYSEMRRFVDLTSEEIGMNHDPNCQGYGGLFDNMSNFYPKFDYDDLVTIIWFYKK